MLIRLLGTLCLSIRVALFALAQEAPIRHPESATWSSDGVLSQRPVFLTPTDSWDQRRDSWDDRRPAPVLVHLTPTLGPTDGGTMLTFSGAHLTAPSDAQHHCIFGHGGSISVGVFRGHSSHGTITCAAPPATDGYEVAVEVSINGGRTYTSGGFRYRYYHEAVVISLSPSSGPAAGGTLVSVSGYSFQAVADLQCAFGGLRRVPATLVNFRMIRCRSPAQTANGSLSLSFEGTSPRLRLERPDMDGHVSLAGAARVEEGVLELASRSGDGSGSVRVPAEPPPPPRLPTAPLLPTTPLGRSGRRVIAAAGAVASEAVQGGCGVLSVLVLRDTHSAPRGFTAAFELLMGGEAARGFSLSYGELRPPEVVPSDVDDGSSGGGGGGGASLHGGLWDEFGAAIGLSVRFVANSPNHHRPLSIEIALDQKVLKTVVLGRGVLLRGAWAPVTVSLDPVTRVVAVTHEHVPVLNTTLPPWQPQPSWQFAFSGCVEMPGGTLAAEANAFNASSVDEPPEPPEPPQLPQPPPIDLPPTAPPALPAGLPIYTAAEPTPAAVVLVDHLRLTTSTMYAARRGPVRRPPRPARQRRPPTPPAHAARPRRPPTPPARAG